ncbi:MAG: hypothetical protein HQL56_13565 [Magnetococcales bacterium]|nr:hypothetical protein [Magnetococcales bacterium]
MMVALVAGGALAGPAMPLGMPGSSMAGMGGFSEMPQQMLSNEASSKEEVLGKRFGRFMESFMEEVDNRGNAAPRSARPARPPGGGYEGYYEAPPDRYDPRYQGERRRPERPLDDAYQSDRGVSERSRQRYPKEELRYDPWGGHQGLSPLMGYDPWGAVAPELGLGNHWPGGYGYGSPYGGSWGYPGGGYTGVDPVPGWRPWGNNGWGPGSWGWGY